MSNSQVQKSNFKIKWLSKNFTSRDGEQSGEEELHVINDDEESFEMTVEQFSVVKEF